MLNQTGVAPIQKAVYVLHQMSEDEKIKEMARLREKALLDEVTARNFERREGAEEEREKWQSIVADKNAEIAELKAKLKGLS